MKLTSPLIVSKDEYSLVYEQIETLSDRMPGQLLKAKQLNIVDDNPIKIEGDDLWQPVPWTARWDEDLEYWCAWKEKWKEKGKIEVTCHKKISKRLALSVSSFFAPSLYTKTGDGWGLEDLHIK